MQQWETIQDAARLLGLSVDTVRKRLRASKLEGRMDGNRWLVLIDTGEDPPDRAYDGDDSPMTDPKDIIRNLEESARALEGQVEALRQELGQAQGDVQWLRERVVALESALAQERVLVQQAFALARPQLEATHSRWRWPWSKR